MTIAIVSDPLYPLADELTTLSATGTVGAYQTWQFTSVPSDSALEIGVAFTDPNGDYVSTFTPDVPGIYALQVNDFIQYNAPADFAGDPAGGEGRIICQGVATGSVHCADTLTLPIQTTLGHSLVLTIGVADATVRTAELGSPSSDIATQCILDATVSAATDALIDVLVSGLDDDLATSANALRVAYEAHRILRSGGVHNVDDTVDVAKAGAAVSVVSAVSLYSDLYDEILGHMVQGELGGAWHNADDTKNSSITRKPSTLADCSVTAADLRYRVYSRHLGQIAAPASHGAADSTNTLAAAKPLPLLLVSVLDYLASASPTAPDGVNTGTTLAESRFGFSA